MKRCLEDSVESSILSCGEELRSDKVEGNSNALILPKRKKQKRKDKRKGNQLLKVHENRKLGRSEKKMQKKLEVCNFPFLTPPDNDSLVDAYRCLKAL